MSTLRLNLDDFHPTTHAIALADILAARHGFVLPADSTAMRCRQLLLVADACPPGITVNGRTAADLLHEVAQMCEDPSPS